MSYVYTYNISNNMIIINCLYMYVYVYIYIYTHTCVYIDIYAYVHTHIMVADLPGVCALLIIRGDNDNNTKHNE